MKLAIIGGAGVRVPLLVNGLAGAELGIEEFALYDTAQPRMAVIADLAARRAGGARVTRHASPASAIDGASFVVTSIRAGGIEARVHDERVALALGLVGQETVGPGGFAMAVRTIPPLVEYAREVMRRAPDAWIINFSNPAGLVTQALIAEAGARVIGICDTPTEVCQEVAHALGVPASECAFDYVGLNHLGFIREVYWSGRPQLARHWTDEAALARYYRTPLFAPARLRELRLLPTEYVFYYDAPGRAVAALQAAGETRGEIIARLTGELFDDLSTGESDPVARYERYLAERSAGYMRIEAGVQALADGPAPWAHLTGYDKIALHTIQAMVRNAPAVIPLNVPNMGNIPELGDDDVVEVPCVVSANGPRALHVGALPPQVRDLVVRVKGYERATISAVFAGTRDALVDALALNPLVPSRELAARFVDAMRR
ncbi:MAG: 6-phospho-beta-glucosidase [Acidobacteriota bacterium]|nr:6-phospho-beta-glucosidase [Acidobacteriota bacterium]